MFASYTSASPISLGSRVLGTCFLSFPGRRRKRDWGHLGRWVLGQYLKAEGEIVLSNVHWEGGREGHCPCHERAPSLSCYPDKLNQM